MYSLSWKTTRIALHCSDFSGGDDHSRPRVTCNPDEFTNSLADVKLSRAKVHKAPEPDGPPKWLLNDTLLVHCAPSTTRHYSKDSCRRCGRRRTSCRCRKYSRPEPLNIVSSGALNSTHSLIRPATGFTDGHTRQGARVFCWVVDFRTSGRWLERPAVWRPQQSTI